MEPGQRRKPPPPPGSGVERPAPGAAASPSLTSEGIMANPVHGRLAARMRSLLPAPLQDSLVIDNEGRVMAGGKKIGAVDNDRLLIDYSLIFSHLRMPHPLRAMAQAGAMVVFIEVKETEASICAGDKIGQKKIYSRI